MRKAFIQTLIQIAEQEPRVVLLTGDLGFMVLEGFCERFPQRYFNVGVAEQNLVGIATGLAEAGFIPFVYSIAPFTVLRPFEFIRNGPVQHCFPLRLVGVGQGMDYGTNGLSHYALEDIGVLRTQPGLTIIAPADAAQAQNALQATWNLPGPVYYRLSKDDERVPGLDGRYEPGKVQVIAEGGEVLILSLGKMAVESARTCEMLRARGITATLGVVAGVAPAPEEDLARLLQSYRQVYVHEAHYITSGLGSLVCEVAASHGLSCQVIRCGICSLPGGISGSRDHLFCRHHVDAISLMNEILQTETREGR